MGLFFVVVLFTVCARLMQASYEKKQKLYEQFSFEEDECYERAGGWQFVFICSCVAAGVMLFISAGLQFSANDTLLDKKIEYYGLVHQMENEVYKHDDAVTSDDVYADIVEWNRQLASNKKNEHSWLIGMFVPNIYDQLDYIETS